MIMKSIEVYTDGACSGNPGPGGWAAVLKFGEHTREISGYEANTTNNRMEISGAIEALKVLKEPCSVVIYSDSSYLVNTMSKGWIQNWQRNGWKNAKKNPVENQDLWQVVLELCKTHQVKFAKVPGHANCAENNRCDELARAEITKNRSARRLE